MNKKKKYIYILFLLCCFFIFIKSDVALANSVIPEYLDFIKYCELEEKVQINPDGSGTLMIKVITDPIFANELKKEKFLEIQGKGEKVSIENILKGEKFYHIESVYFKNLEELRSKDEIIKIRVIKKV